jgi:hypothetical protein
MADPGGFLARWSRLKQAARWQQTAKAAPSEGEAKAVPSDVPPEDLPPIETLTADSDFTPFMRPGVPDALRNSALRKLWQSDPALANLDGLVEYGEDYAAAYNAPAVVGTAYRVLQGMPKDETEAASETPPPADADEPDARTAAADQPEGPIAAPDGRPKGDGID